MRKQFLVGVISVFAIFKTHSFEVWGPTGHRATGEIAEKYLTRKAKRNINKLLKGQSLAFVSTFADEIKSDKKYNEFYAWHYINMSIDKTYGISMKNKKGDLVTGIKSCIAVLKSKNSSVEEDMENDADNELDENETGSDFLSGTFTRYTEDIIILFPFITT